MITTCSEDIWCSFCMEIVGRSMLNHLLSLTRRNKQWYRSYASSVRTRAERISPRITEMITFGDNLDLPKMVVFAETEFKSKSWRTNKQNKQTKKGLNAEQSRIDTVTVPTDQLLST